jgi:hypothetical protein
MKNVFKKHSYINVLIKLFIIGNIQSNGNLYDSEQKSSIS